MSDRGPNYWDYLRLDRLLDLQGGVEGDDALISADELHFIIVHQVYELWFKLVLRHLRLGRNALSRPKVDEALIPRVVHHLGRVTKILALAVDQMAIVETLTPQDFLAFRSKLVPASGFQSFQMRELEIVMGLDEAQRIQYGEVHPITHIRDLGQSSPAGRLAWQHMERAMAEPTFLSALHEWLYRTPIQGSTPGDEGDAAVVDAFLTDYIDALERNHTDQLARLVTALGEGERDRLETKFDGIIAAAHDYLFAKGLEDTRRVRRVRAAALFIESYRDLALLAWPRLLLDAVVELEEQMVLFRHRHARMVERVIGRRVGTGGSGVEYLDKTATYRVFRDLWAIRTVLLPKADLPPLKSASFYGFAAE